MSEAQPSDESGLPGDVEEWRYFSGTDRSGEIEHVRFTFAYTCRACGQPWPCEASKASSPTKRVQVGWMNPATGVVCDCPVYETSPHANSVPIYREVAGG